MSGTHTGQDLDAFGYDAPAPGDATHHAVTHLRSTWQHQDGAALLDDTEARRRAMSRIRSATWLDAQEFPPLEWVVPDVVPEGYGLLVGPPKIGKSWLTLALALAAASGGTALGSVPVTARPVLYLALEDGYRRLQTRSRTLTGGAPLPAGLDLYTEPGPDVLTHVLPGWLEQHGHEHPLVVLDTLGTVQPPKTSGESEYQRDYRFGQHLRSYLTDRPGSALLVVHHVRKAQSGDWMDSTSGTNGVNGSADYTLALTADREATAGTLSVTGRDVQARTYALVLHDGAWALDGGTLTRAADRARATRAAQDLGDTQTTVITALAHAPGPVRAADVARSTGLDPKQASDYLGRLARSGRVVRAGRGLYTLPPANDTGPGTTTAPEAPPGFDTLDTFDTPSQGEGVGSASATAASPVCRACHGPRTPYPGDGGTHPTCRPAAPHPAPVPGHHPPAGVEHVYESAATALADPAATLVADTEQEGPR